MNRLKEFLGDFPNQNGAVVTGLFLILTTGLVVDVMLILGKPFPDGYDTWIWALIALAGVNVVGMIGKRATDIELAKAKNPPTVEAASTVTTAVTTSTSTTAPATAPVPAAPMQPPPVPPAARDD
jgi:hypothetical protein